MLKTIRIQGLVAYAVAILIVVSMISIIHQYDQKSHELEPLIMAQGLQVLQNTKWKVIPGKRIWHSKRSLTYAISNMVESDIISRNDIRSSIASAFSSWASVITLTFEEIDNFKAADIKIEFFSGEHGDGSPFDGKMGILSHAFAPEDGRFHLDSDEIWTVNIGRTDDECAIDLETVALHEIGHLIGLDHSNVTGSVMFPSIEARSVNRELKPDDIEGARYLYGPSNHFNNMPEPGSYYYTAATMPAPLPCFSILFPFILSSILFLCG
ncbi:hypothetical protein SUGI_1074820 [Cryptomeria japonica]|uniref:metalloendoproteinase 1-MMP-like n=1 Tax=Cryptomeria japonica TaxID=3369 RepID=UPI00241476AD|nr:metalloendoproteinase 1-MMP-like [Cryptomeria japonica]GLJ50442.1 hypothetical protein SUGI_1074820 [Cryptomeria japonica]